MERKLDELFSLLRTPQSVSPASGIGTGVDARPTESIEAPEEQSLVEAEQSLAVFKEQLKFFPCADVSCYATAAELAAKRPVFWLAIRTVTTRVSSEQKHMNRRLRETFNRHLIGDCAPSIDLLLGLLTYIGW